MTQRKPILATRVSPIINKYVRQLAETLGITVPEYLRKLILDDLESKKLFNEQFTKTVDQSEVKKPEESLEEHIKKLLSEPYDEEGDDKDFW